MGAIPGSAGLRLDGPSETTALYQRETMNEDTPRKLDARSRDSWVPTQGFSRLAEYQVRLNDSFLTSYQDCLLLEDVLSR